MALNGAITVILHYFTECRSFGAHYVTTVKDRPILLAKKCRQRFGCQPCNNLWWSTLFEINKITDNECVKQLCPHSKSKTRFVQHYADMSAH